MSKCKFTLKKSESPPKVWGFTADTWLLLNLGGTNNLKGFCFSIFSSSRNYLLLKMGEKVFYIVSLMHYLFYNKWVYKGMRETFATMEAYGVPYCRGVQSRNIPYLSPPSPHHQWPRWRRQWIIEKLKLGIIAGTAWKEARYLHQPC